MKKKRVGKVIVLVLLVFALLIGCGYAYLYNNGLSGKSIVTQPQEGQIRVACVGDSITYGHGINGWSKNNYPVLLQGLLGEDYHVQSFGVSGRAVQDSSDQPYRALRHYQDSLAYDADILVFMMGSNDSKPENWMGREAFEAALRDLLDDYSAEQVILCTPAKAFFAEGFTDNLTSHDIQPVIVDEIADIVRSVAGERGDILLDIHSLTAGNRQWFAKDGVHPDNTGAAAIAQAVHDAVLDLCAQ